MRNMILECFSTKYFCSSLPVIEFVSTPLRDGNSEAYCVLDNNHQRRSETSDVWVGGGMLEDYTCNNYNKAFCD